MTVTLEKTRTIEEVFASHREALETLDFQKLANDYAEDALLVSLDGSFKGREAIMTGWFQSSLSQFPDVKFHFEKTAFEDDICLLQWSADSSMAAIPRGTAVFVIRNGLIQRQAEWFEVVPK